MGDAVDLDVITAAGVRRITVDRPGVAISPTGYPNVNSPTAEKPA